MNQHNHKYITVPDNFTYHHEEQKYLSSGWNYNRYQNIYFYKIPGGIIVQNNVRQFSFSLFTYKIKLYFYNESE